MKIKFSFHAIERIKERGIEKSIIFDAIASPDKMETSSVKSDRFLFKKIYFNLQHKRDHLLIIVCEKEEDVLKVITIIDTSKISKHF
ncbi:MAG: hypothetical protein A2312_03590 [Candidatus Staskawiczbacteria bacterium RIFOXYB2_FULL_32_9]|uniref:DUF4258 domain-containing protein n=1 Tax=Candidatus Staskawiczbacteria bacterium RIFOXYD1_FULL_32_13 TaxID=1802234 RepID=A0A1G2JT34_9BACT|nr:MAG: hypothetical protein UR22_C0011G0018 [Parcubacteria group bacterium GW2011_GWC2_32_10]OGZ77917.1 MAG: hypothetical protein A2360_00100 [Candidatus Staskawiczbacteria bacterium RIFOXYB1_FULL_32_11]OGZ78323.1 MAG: hypothetical protein A2256_01650 [Candidatus Staskawiczbacteria bacterium RIFOXYA2_FULL_32_7]OGZ82539.1 MAG: hypothetical protein A2312_03590 [Candidatus Staskawiczbacteria bacterium RIFOXYB2_FULL_32_9]OGZ89611.1 MAG: hypothetical protein A2561_03705 [Candidatus Staskawiczbacter